MTRLLLTGWLWNPEVVALTIGAMAAYLGAFGWQRRAWFFLGAAAALLMALISPIEALAEGYLFSAHMMQHLLLLLVTPGLVLLSLPRNFVIARGSGGRPHPLAGWISGVGAMWVWHAPALCSAAVHVRWVYALQTVSLLALGGIFWWQVLAPAEEERLSPPAGICYLFTACTACGILGIILTFSPVTVCAGYTGAADPLNISGMIRNGWGMTPAKDQQLGGLLMWVPMCLIYLAAICQQLARWLGEPAQAPETAR